MSGTKPRQQQTAHQVTKQVQLFYDVMIVWHIQIKIDSGVSTF